MPHARPLDRKQGRALCDLAKHGLWVVAAILVAGCSGGFDKYFGTDKAPPKPPEPKAATEESTDAAQEVPGKEQAYPNLGSVPQTKPVRQSAQDQTQAVAKGLVADRQNARYTDEVIRRDPVQAASVLRPGAPTAPRLPTAPGAAPAADKAPPPAPEPKLAAAPTLPSAPPAAPTSPPPAAVPAGVPPAAPPAADAAQPVLPAPQPAQPPMSSQVAQPADAPPVAAPPTQMLLGTQVAQAIAPRGAAEPLPIPPPAATSVSQPPSVAPSPATAPSMASVAQPQFQPPPPPVIPGYAGAGAPQQAPQPIAPQPGVSQAAPAYPQQAYPQQAYPQQAYPQQPQLAALPPSPPPAMARPVLTPPPGYGLPPAASALAPAPSAPYVPTAAPANPIRPPPPPISPALPAMAGRSGAYDPAIAEARTRAGGASAGSDAAAVAEARRRAAFSPGQQVGLLLFDNGSASLSQADRTLLQRVAAVARQNGAVVRVVGHASSRTGEMNVPSHLNKNLNISEARASAAAAELNAAGLPSERIVIEAKGDSEPLYSEAMPSGEAGNRRVDVYLQ